MISESSDKAIIGDCCISVTHSTTYEPPLYLFRELLPKVSQNTKSVVVWDGVADAIDVENSFWRVSNSQLLSEASKYAGLAERTEPHTETDTLATMIASNRLASAGMTADILSKGQFSSHAIINELEVHCKVSGFSEKEKALLMSNHFLNLLAWMKLRELNYSFTRTHAEKNERDTKTRKRSRVDEAEKSGNLPLPSPWFTEMDESFVPGRFISGLEKDVEKKIEALESLSCLYNGPVLSLCSRGQQTDYVVPPGTINTTSPYNVLPSSSGKAVFHSVSDLQWSSDLFSIPALIEARILCVLSGVPHETVEKEVIPLRDSCVHFGRLKGLIRSTSGGSSTRVQIGLGDFTSFPDVISPLQFSIYQVCSDTVLLLNYGRNGIRLQGNKWVLGEALTLKLPVVITVTKDLSVELVACEGNRNVDHSFTVKQEDS